MAASYEYILSLNDKVSGAMRKITGNSVEAIGKFIQLDDKTKALQKTVVDFGGSIYNLKQKIDLLQQERDLIDPKNLTQIRRYNSEIKKLTGEVEKLETINGSKFKGYVKDAFSELPAIVKNPVALGVATVRFSVKSAIDFDENMAKVNVTAQLDEKGLFDLKAKVKAITAKNGGDITFAPIGLEKIISQTGDAALSIDILDSAMRGAKGGFTDVDTISGALAQTLSIIGKENANAAEVLDTFFAAKRVGAGEFADFARYMPGLIAGGSNLGIAYKEVAGTFAYMTGKGQSAEKAAVLMENAFSALGKSDIQKAMQGVGVNIYDAEGKMRSLVAVATDLKGVMAGRSDEQKANLLESLGLRDKEAKNAFAILTADVDKLAESMGAVQLSTGETDRAIELSANTMQRITELWNRLKLKGLEVGEIMLPAVNLGVSLLSGALTTISPILNGVVSLVSWLGTALSEGNPLIVAAAAGLTTLAIAMQGAAIATSLKTGAMAIATVATKAWAVAQNLLNVAFWANPITWIVVGVVALTAAVVYCYQKFDWFRGAVYASWEAIKGFGIVIKDYVIDRIKGVLSGIKGVGSALLKLFQGDFKGAWAAAKEGVSDLIGIDAIKNATTGAMQVGRNAAAAYKKGVASINTSEIESPILSTSATEKQITPTATPIGALTAADAINSKFPTIKTDKAANPINMDMPAPQQKGSTVYNAIVAKLAPVKIAAATMAAAAMPLTMPSSAALPAPHNATATEQAVSLQDHETTNRPTISVDRFCDSIVINIASSDGKGHDAIRHEIQQVIKQVIEDYDA